ncbi:uncharacterized protein [Anser cygnoides]|uniref:uncharacterized protein isoform X1 n=1 Tax=Anser cygnoides TaxID=8845 RepID=UPI0034D2EC29
MCKTMPTFILLFTGYFVKNMHVHATESSLLKISTSYVTEASEQETAAAESKTVTTNPETGFSPVPEESSLYVAATSISLVIILICIIVFLWFKWKLSKGSSAEINPVPSSEAVVTLKNTKL